MATGKIKKLVHLSQQTYLPNTRLVPDHDDKGYPCPCLATRRGVN